MSIHPRTTQEPAEPDAAHVWLSGAVDGEAATFQPIRKAFEQVADQLRDHIISGRLGPSERLPNEESLARNFGVSRSTVREALRMLAAQQLIRTTKGVGGGSFVTLPTVDHISDFVQGNLSLLTESRHVSLQEFLEARELLEVSAARYCALRRSEETLHQLTHTIDNPPGDSAPHELGRNYDFHSTVIQSCGNTLLTMAAQPIFTVLQTHLLRTTLTKSFLNTVHDDHVTIADAIQAGDADAAAEEMRRHLGWLRTYHEKWWRHR
jgi:DNA-binding FadR family transcriptional regulator